MMILWVAGILLIGQTLLVLTLIRVVRTFGVYTDRLLATHYQNVHLRKNIAIQQNEEAIRFLTDHSTERKEA